MRWMFVVLLLAGCAIDLKARHEGCESFKYFCIGCYDRCGEVDVDASEYTTSEDTE